MEVLQQIIHAFSSAVPNAGMLLLFPVAALAMGAFSMVVTVIGSTLDTNVEEKVKEKRAERLLLEQLKRQDEAELNNI